MAKKKTKSVVATKAMPEAARKHNPGPIKMEFPATTPMPATFASASADLADRTHDARAPRRTGPVVPVPDQAGEYVQDFGSLDAIISREARKRNARDDREGVY